MHSPAEEERPADGEIREREQGKDTHDARRLHTAQCHVQTSRRQHWHERLERARSAQLLLPYAPQLGRRLRSLRHDLAMDEQRDRGRDAHCGDDMEEENDRVQMHEKRLRQGLLTDPAPIA